MADGQIKTETPVGEVAHSCVGRTRMCFSALKGESDALEALRQQVLQLDGVVDVEVRPLTGSVIVAHWGFAEDLVQDARDKGVFRTVAASEGATPETRAQSLAINLESTIAKLFGKKLDIRTLAAFAFAAMAIRQIAAGVIAPPAATALWSSAILLLAEKGLTKLGDANGPAAD